MLDLVEVADRAVVLPFVGVLFFDGDLLFGDPPLEAFPPRPGVDCPAVIGSILFLPLAFLLRLVVLSSAAFPFGMIYGQIS